MYSIGTGVAKELIHMAYEHEKGGGLSAGVEGAGWKGTKGEKVRTTV